MRSNEVVKIKVRKSMEIYITGYTNGKGKDSNCIIWISD